MSFKIFRLQPALDQHQNRFANPSVRGANEAYGNLVENVSRPNPPTPHDRIERDQAFRRYADSFAEATEDSKHGPLDQPPRRGRDKQTLEQLVERLLEQRGERTRPHEARPAPDRTRARERRYRSPSPADRDRRSRLPRPHPISRRRQDTPQPPTPPTRPPVTRTTPPTTRNTTRKKNQRGGGVERWNHYL